MAWRGAAAWRPPHGAMMSSISPGRAAPGRGVYWLTVQRSPWGGLHPRAALDHHPRPLGRRYRRDATSLPDSRFSPWRRARCLLAAPARACGSVSRASRAWWHARNSTQPLRWAARAARAARRRFSCWRTPPRRHDCGLWSMIRSPAGPHPTGPIWYRQGQA